MLSGAFLTMANIIDYLERRRNESLLSLPFTPPDNLILSKLSSFDWSGIIPADSEKRVALSEASMIVLESENARERVKCKDDLLLLELLASSKRFGGAELAMYSVIEDGEEEQFGALSILLPDHTLFISYRGTDASLSGWREDFEMSFSSEIKSQHDALLYLKSASSAFSYPIRLGGHSKGGNIAIYSAAKAPRELQERIIRVYSDDGPGFSDSFLQNEGYKNIIDRISTYVPQTSIIGMMLEHKEKYRVIRSDSIGILQHLLYSWEIDGDDFVYLDDVDNHSKHISRALKSYLEGVSPSERAEIVDFAFSVLSSGADRIPELIKPKAIASSLHALSSRDRSERVKIAEELSRFLISLISSSNSFSST